jgi:hypothetical protein
MKLNEVGGGHQWLYRLLYVVILILINESMMVTLSSKKTIQYILSMTQNLYNC